MYKYEIYNGFAWLLIDRDTPTRLIDLGRTSIHAMVKRLSAIYSKDHVVTDQTDTALIDYLYRNELIQQTTSRPNGSRNHGARYIFSEYRQAHLTAKLYIHVYRSKFRDTGRNTAYKKIRKMIREYEATCDLLTTSISSPLNLIHSLRRFMCDHGISPTTTNRNSTKITLVPAPIANEVVYLCTPQSTVKTINNVTDAPSTVVTATPPQYLVMPTSQKPQEVPVIRPPINKPQVNKATVVELDIELDKFQSIELDHSKVNSNLLELHECVSNRITALKIAPILKTPVVMVNYHSISSTFYWLMSYQKHSALMTLDYWE